jgi:hypothetical protein
MTCERRYTESAISEMHAIEQLAELRRWITETIAERQAILLSNDSLFNREDDGTGSVYTSGFIDALCIAQVKIDELFPDYSRCDNPPAK